MAWSTGSDSRSLVDIRERSALEGTGEESLSVFCTVSERTAGSAGRNAHIYSDVVHAAPLLSLGGRAAAMCMVAVADGSDKTHLPHS